MKKNDLRIVLLTGLTATLIACNGGGKGGGGNYPLLQCGGGTGGSTWESNPYSCPQQGSYKGTLYSELPQPNQSNNGVLSKQYPNSYLPTYLFSSVSSVNKSTQSGKGLQIAYGRNDETAVAKISAFVTMDNSICSATPVKYDVTSDTTFLIGAAHCFVDSKPNPTQLESTGLMPTESLAVYYGVAGLGRTPYTVKAVYLQQNYCYGDSFGVGGECSNFSPDDEVVNGQGNDIAVIQINGEFGGTGNHINYPNVESAGEYPNTNSLAPILSIGYGINTQTPNGSSSCTSLANCTAMYYVAGYQYAKADTLIESSGYHYLFNSFYTNANTFGKVGYTALICGGDSGGGDLFWTGSKWILLSEHTYGPLGACGTFFSSLPNGATNVSAYYDWIMSIFATPVNSVANCKNGTIPNCVTNG